MDTSKILNSIEPRGELIIKWTVRTEARQVGAGRSLKFWRPFDPQSTYTPTHDVTGAGRSNNPRPLGGRARSNNPRPLGRGPVVTTPTARRCPCATH